MEWIKEIWSEILNKSKEHIAAWVVGLISLLLIFVFNKYLTTEYTFTLPLWGWIIICVVISSLIPIILKIIDHRRKSKVLTDADDIKRTINDWFNDKFMFCPFTINESIHFEGLEESLNIQKEMLRKYLPMLARQKKYGIEIGKETFTLVSLTNHNDFALFIREYLQSEKDSKECLIPTYDLDKKLRWPMGTACNCLDTFWEFEGRHLNCKLEDKGNGEILMSWNK